MKIFDTPLAGLHVVRTAPVADARGQFVRVFCERELASLRPDWRFPQVNQSTTRLRGTVRGMHYQVAPMAEAKLIRCLRGRVFDVAVDVRAGSPTFLHWHGIELSEDRPEQFYLPEGFAHGFQALSDDAQLLYMHTQPWSREHERGIRFDDPRLSIPWPLPLREVSERDQSFPPLDADFAGIAP